MTKSDPDCLFCKIVAKNIPAAIICENENTLAFLDVMPRALGHTMVIPKYHAAKLSELPEEEVGPLFSAAKSTGALLEKSLSPDGMTIGINQGEASGQVVGHVHVHLMPRWKNDGGGSIQSVVDSRPQMTIDEVQKKILNTKK